MDLEHPLEANDKWEPRTLQITAGAEVMIISSEKGKKDHRSYVIQNAYCREVLIYNTRKSLFSKVHPPGAKDNKVFLNVPELKNEDQEKNRLVLDKTFFSREEKLIKPLPEEEEFLKVCDVLCGLTSVALAAKRPKGRWWESPKNSSPISSAWNGSDNWFIRHPVLYSILTGFFRQSYFLCKAGVGSQVIDMIPRKELERILTDNDREKACSFLINCRPWIEVPIAYGKEQGNLNNQSIFPCPMGHWEIFERLLKVKSKYGYKKIFGKDFLDSWVIKNKNSLFDSYFNGPLKYWNFLGLTEDTPDHVANRKRLKDLELSIK